VIATTGRGAGDGVSRAPAVSDGALADSDLEVIWDELKQP
jgi:hypothetical protein